VNCEYILISPVHNEEAYIERTIKCIIAQSVPPKKWVIVNDSSTDKTDEIIKQYESQYDFISYLYLQHNDAQSYYDRKIRAFLSGYEKIKDTKYEFLGCLDADISLEPTYYESILEKFDHNPKLGVASGVYLDEVNGRLRRIFIARISTPGAIQLFRRQCYEEIGGYIPLKYGGVDTLSEIMARMAGWETKSFPKYKAIHHRPVGKGLRNGVLHGKLYQGFIEYQLGTHPLFMVAKSILRAFWERPLFFASATRMTGYLYAHLKKEERRIPDKVMNFYRNEQMRRLRACFRCQKRKGVLSS